MLDDGGGTSVAGAISPQPIGSLPCFYDRLRPLEKTAILVGRELLVLVTADVDPRTRRQRGQLADDVLDEGVGDLLVDAERAEADLDAGVERRGLPSQFSFGYDASAAFVWLGMSISGTIVMYRSAA